MKDEEFRHYYSEHRHNKRYHSQFWMFVVIGIVLAITLVVAINANMTSNSIFDWLIKSNPITTAPISGSGAITPGNQTNCTDSDGGINPFLKGVCIGKNGIYTDSCNDTNISLVREYYCGKNGDCKSLIENCAWFKNLSTGICIDGMCQLKPNVVNEVNALMLSMMHGIEIKENGGVDLATMNIQSARTRDDNPVVDGIFGGFGAKCDCVGCSGSGGCESGNNDFLGCIATSCQCPSRQDPSNCFWNIQLFGYWAW